MLNRLFLLVLTAIVIWPPASAAQSGIRKLDLATYLDFESVADPRLSPDGRRVVYTRQWFDKMNDRRESSLDRQPRWQPKPLFDRRFESAVVAERRPDRIHRLRRASGSTSLRALDG